MIRRRTDAARIKLGGRYLDEVQIRLDPPAWSKPRGASFVIFPAEHHSAIVDGDVATIRVRTLTAAQLLFDGALPAVCGAVNVCVGENDLGPFRVESLQTPESISDQQFVVLRLRERLAKKASALEDGGVGAASVALSTRGCPASGCAPVWRICSRVW